MQFAEAQVALNLFEALDTPRSLTAAIMLRYELYDQLTQLSIDPRSYNDLYPERYLLDAAATDFLRKSDFLPLPGLDLKQEAWERFLRVERKNAQTNARLQRHLDEVCEDQSDVRILDFFSRVRKITARVLGPVPDSLNGSFGPGATFQDLAPLTTVPDKMSSVPTMTRSARAILPIWKQTAWGRAVDHGPSRSIEYTTVRGDRYTTVPKDSRKRRSITVQPSVNVYYQLGIGKHIRARLRRFGIDLDRGQQLHQALACASSWSGEYATADLSDASDTIARNLIKLCLPRKWYDLLDMFRCPLTRMPSRPGSPERWLWNEKFSAMGNGYTFELETLVFASIVAVACSGDVSNLGWTVFAYGDDLIYPVEHHRSVYAALTYCGFSVNAKKTFSSGSFRESCGGDFFKGVRVRPHYLKEALYGPEDYIALANGIRRLAKQISARSAGHHRALLRVWHKLLDNVPKHIRACRGPESLGDLVIHDEPSRWVTRPVKTGLGSDDQQLELMVWMPVNPTLSWDHWRPDVVMASALYGLDSAGVTPLNRGVAAVTGHRVGWAAITER